VLVNEGEGWRDGEMGGVGEWVLAVAHLEEYGGGGFGIYGADTRALARWVVWLPR